MWGGGGVRSPCLAPERFGMREYADGLVGQCFLVSNMDFELMVEARIGRCMHTRCLAGQLLRSQAHCQLHSELEP